MNLFWDPSFPSKVMQCELLFKPFWFVLMELFMGDRREWHSSAPMSREGISLDGFKEESTEC